MRQDDKRASKNEDREAVPLRDLARVIRGLESSNSESYHRTAAMLRVQVRTGMRSGELVQLRASECETIKGELYFTVKNHKMAHKGQGRVVWLNQKARDAIASLWRAGNSYVFHDKRSMTPKQQEVEVKSYAKRVKTACERYGV